MTYFNNAGHFLIDTIVGLYVLLLLIRFWLHWTRSDFRNPVGQFLITVTNPVIVPFGRLITNHNGFAIISLLAAFILTTIKLFILVKLSGFTPNLGGVLLYAVGELIKSSIYIFMVCVFIRVISSWFAQLGQYNPMMSVIYSLSEPIMAPARRLIPSLSGIDLSPIVVFIFLQLSLILIVGPILGEARLY